MKILHVIASLAPRYGGPSQVLPQMCAALASRGHDVEIFTTDIDGGSTANVPLGVPIRRNGVDVWHYHSHWPRSYVASFPLARALRGRVMEFDVVHLHSLYLFHTLVTSRMCQRYGIPYILRPHGTLDPYHRAEHRIRKFVYETLVDRVSLKGAAAIHCTSEAEKCQVEGAELAAPCTVIPHGVNFGAEDFSGSPLLAEYPQLEGRLLITFLGRLARKKGLNVLIDGFAAVADRYPNAMLVVAGPEDQIRSGDLLKRARGARCVDRFVCLPPLADEAKADLLRRTTVFVLPSADESFGVAVAEAMAAGVPVVITKGVALHPSVSASRAGLVVERTPEGVARGLLDLLGNSEMRRQMGRNGQELVARSFSWSVVAEQLERMYELVVNAPSRAGAR